MKFGVALPYAGARAVAALCQAAEESGWDGCFLGDAIWCEDPLIGLAAAAMTTSRIRLGTMIIPAPLRRPWKLASESLALDHLSNGRLILGLGTGAVWMGWQGFPDEVTDTRARAEMLDECIDILTLLYQRKQVDYDGKHYHLNLTQVDEAHYPPMPVQQPRIPLWVVGVWGRAKSMQRVLKCDGVFVEKMNDAGKGEAATPEDIRALKTFVAANRTLTTPFDIVMQGSTTDLEPAERQQMLHQWQDSGVTWWIEPLFGVSVEAAEAMIRQRSPHMG